MHARMADPMARSIRLRPWQAEALQRFGASASPDFLVVATPGAGKTTLALAAAVGQMADGVMSRIVVVTPTQHLKGQWAEAATRFGLHLDDRWSAADGAPPSDMSGIVTTYQQVASSAEALRAITSSSFVVLDEIHHAGDDKAWGSAILRAFENAPRRLSLSGTPFRSDTSAIPFVDYHFDEAVPDMEYGYGDALVDRGVVRPVYFPAFGGHMEWVAPDGEEFSATFQDSVGQRRANERLRTALSLEGQWLPAVLQAAHGQLCALRTTHPDAGGLVIAMDQEHATGIADLLRARCGVDAVVAVSDDPRASRHIADFAASDRPWIVAVRMVSEGVDIPRLRVGVHATNTTTELFFRQGVGRIVRWIRGVGDQAAFFFIPDDPRLRTWAASIADHRRHSLRRRGGDDERSSETTSRDVATSTDDSEQMSLFSVISAVATDQVPLEPSVFSEGITDRWEEPGDDEGVDFHIVGLHGAPTSVTDDDAPRRRTKSQLREANAEAVRDLVRLTGRDHRVVNSELNRQAGIAKVTAATISELERRLDAARSWGRSVSGGSTRQR